MGVATKLNDDRKTGQSDLFGGGSEKEDQDLNLKPVPAWRQIEKLNQEFDAVGFYLSGHPLDEFKEVLTRLKAESWLDFRQRVQNTEGGLGILAGTVSTIRERRSKSGNLYAFIEFSDATGQFEAIAFSDTLDAHRDILVPGTPVLAKVDADIEDDNIRLRLQKAQTIEAAAKSKVRGLKIIVAKGTELEELREFIGTNGGRGEIRLGLQLDDFSREVEVTLPGKYETSLDRAASLRTIDGVIAVKEL